MLKKALFIAQKDFLIRLYDRTGFAFLVVTPLIVTLIMGAVFGGSDDDEANFRVPVAILNYDQGVSTTALGQNIVQEQLQGTSGATNLNSDAIRALIQDQLQTVFSEGADDETIQDLNTEALNFGQVIADLFLSEDFAGILDATRVDDEANTRMLVDNGNPYCCLVIIPENFSRAILLDETAEVIVYSDPAQDVNRQIIESIVNQVTQQFASGTILFDLTFKNLAAIPASSTDLNIEDIINNLTASFDQDNFEQGGLSLIEVETISISGETVDFDPIAFFAPSLAIMFLAFGAAAGTQSIRLEETMGTLGRLNASPIASASILFGKLLGTFAASGLQFGILLVLSVLIFGLRWGDPAAVIIMSILITIAFTCLGLVMAVIAKDINQANVISNAVILVFSLIGGNLTPASNFPSWMQNIAQITPNYWSVQSFIKLGLSQRLPDLVPEIIALSIISLILFGVGSMLYQRRIAV
ncbi:MAG: ABC transporter permease [Chloroflexota bacterium]